MLYEFESKSTQHYGEVKRYEESSGTHGHSATAATAATADCNWPLFAIAMHTEWNDAYTPILYGISPITLADSLSLSG